MTPESMLQHKVQKFYDTFAKNYDKNRYGNRKQLAIDAIAKKIVLDLLSEEKLESLNVLDCGCGTGRFAQLFSDKKATVVGVDSSPNMLAMAQKKVPNATFILGDIFNLNFHKEFDIVLSSQVLTHLHEYERPLQSMKEAAKEGGIIIIDIRNIFSLKNLFSTTKAKLLSLFGKKMDYNPHYTSIYAMKKICKKLDLNIAEWRGYGERTKSTKASEHFYKMFQPTLVLRIQK